MRGTTTENLVRSQAPAPTLRFAYSSRARYLRIAQRNLYLSQRVETANDSSERHRNVNNKPFPSYEGVNGPRLHPTIRASGLGLALSAQFAESSIRVHSQQASLSPRISGSGAFLLVFAPTGTDSYQFDQPGRRAVQSLEGSHACAISLMRRFTRAIPAGGLISTYATQRCRRTGTYL